MQPGADAPAAETPPGRAAAQASSGGRSRLIWLGAAALLVAGGAFAFHTMSSSAQVPGITGKPDTTTASASSTPLDPAKVGALMQKISSNPKDTAALSALADMYFQSGDYTSSATFSQKLAAVDPKNVSAWVGLGAAQFNLGKAADAEKTWLTAVSVDPKNAEAHYDLGFLYLSAAKPDIAKVQSEWQKVIAIDPTSDIAKTVQTHLKSLASAAPSSAAGTAPSAAAIAGK
jgi:Flp pilus assembly protein TadD